MSEIIKKFTIAGASDDTRDIGAEAQNIIVSYDSNGDVIEDITVTTPDTTGSLAEDLNNRALKNHASSTSDYGAASSSEYGHIKLGVGLEVDAESGATRVKYGTGSGTAAAGNDVRLSDKRVARNAVTFTDGAAIPTEKSYDGSVAQTVSYNDVGAAKKNHASSTVEYGAASKNNFGHVKIGDGIDIAGGVISVKAAGGSTIQIFTSETDLHGKDITITAEQGSNPVTAKFDNDGYAIVKGYSGTGTITFTSQGTSLTAVGSMNIPYFGNYSITLAFWSANVTITTPTVEMYNRTIRVKNSNGLVIGNTSFNASGVATYSVHAAGTYTFECDLGWKTFTGSVNATVETDYNTTITGYVSNITITTVIDEFFGQTLTVTQISSGGSMPTSTISFDSVGQATFTVYEPGTYKFALVYEGETYDTNVIVTTAGNYAGTIYMWTATVNITTESSQFYNQTITVTDSQGGSVGTTTFDSSGSASYRIHRAGTYTFSVTLNE